MASNPTRKSEPKRTSASESAIFPDDFPLGLGNEFFGIPELFWRNYGVVTGRVLSRGGYIGISVTDDGGSCKLAVRCPYISFEKRLYKLADAESVIAYLLTKTQD